MKRDVEQRYWRWLLAYPRPYRRIRGEELVTTLVASAPGGPTLRIGANLIRHGIRARLGRPGSRSVVLWSIVGATIGGLFVAALASWAAWWTSRPEPDAAEARAIFADVFPDYQLGEIYAPKSLFTIYGEPLSTANVGTLLSFDGGEYGLASTGADTLGPPPIPAEQALATAERRLQVGGWQVFPPVATDVMACGSKQCVPQPSTRTAVTARRGDTIMSFVLYADAGPEETNLGVSLQRTAPPLVLPATLAGAMIGFVMAWLVFAWASRRSAGPAGVAASVFYAIAMLSWWCPVALAALSLWSFNPLDSAAEPHPLWEWLGQPALAPVFLVGCGAVILALIVAALTRPSPPERTIA